MKSLTVCLAFLLVVTGCGDDGASGDASEFCEEFATFLTLPEDPTGALEALGRLADSAPSEISDAVGVLVDVVEGSLSDDAEVPDGFFEAAADINAYVRNTCGIDPDTGDPLDPGSRYSLAITGEVEVEHTGDDTCTEFQGELSIDFTPDQFSGGDYRLVAPDAGLRDGDFEAFFTYEADDGTESEGAIVMSIAYQPLEGSFGGGATGTFEGSFEGAAGSGEVRGEFACEVGIVVE